MCVILYDRSIQMEPSETTKKTKASFSSSSEFGVVRPELNLEKWPSLWEPAKSRRVFKTRVIERQITLPNGSIVTARVRVAPSTEGTLTTEEQRHLYGLIRIWEENGKSIEDVTSFSLQRLAKVLKKGWGPRNIETMIQSLTRLLATTIFWENAYFDKTTGETKKELHGFHILEELYIAHRTDTNDRITHEACYFRFNDFILKNMLANYTKPVLLDTVLSFQSDIAQILYTYLDLLMSNKQQFRRRSRELFEDIGLEGAAYLNISDRKRTLERILKELQGVPLTTGYIIAIGLEKTSDNKDYNLVVRKGRTCPPIVLVEPEPIQATTPIEKGTTNDNESFSLAIEQVRYFYTIFHQNQEAIQISTKEKEQALDHLNRLGKQGARFLVDFAFQEAPKTQFSIQTYGGILGYEARAMKALQETQSRDVARKHAEQAQALQKLRKSHESRFYEAYCNYLRRALADMETQAPEAFVDFMDNELKERQKYVKLKMQVFLRDHFDREEAMLERFATFFYNHPHYPVIDFWQWDAAHNPESFTN